MKKEDQHKDKWLKAHFDEEDKKSKLSSNFTHQLMQKIQEDELKPKVKPLPLFGWSAWVISFVFVVLIALSIIFAPSTNNSTVTTFNVETPELDAIIQSESFITFSLIISSVALLMLVDHFLLKKLR